MTRDEMKEWAIDYASTTWRDDLSWLTDDDWGRLLDRIEYWHSTGYPVGARGEVRMVTDLMEVPHADL